MQVRDGSALTPEVNFDRERVSTALHRTLDGAPGSVCVMRGGEVLLDEVSGSWAHEPEGNATRVFGFSLTKGVTATVVAWLVGSGRLDYEQRIASVWPEFAAHDKQDVTLGMLLTHQAGLSAIPEWLDEDPGRYPDAAAIEAALAAGAPSYEPGTACGYHALTFGWLVNGFIRRATGNTIRDHAVELFEDLGIEEIALRSSDLPPGAKVAPLEGLHDAAAAASASQARTGTWVGIAPRSEARAALGGRALGTLLADPSTWDIEQPALNVLCSSRGLAALYDSIAVDSNSPLARGMYQALRYRCDSRDRVLGFPMHWQGGYQAILSRRGYEPNLIGHRGFGGSGGWLDTESGLSCGFMTPRMTAKPFMDFRFADVTTAVCEAFSP